MSEDYERGQRDGLRLAIALLATEEAKWAALLGRSRARRTNASRAVRQKTLAVAQTRLATALRRLTVQVDEAVINDELVSALDRLGL